MNYYRYVESEENELQLLLISFIITSIERLRVKRLENEFPLLPYAACDKDSCQKLGFEQRNDGMIH